MDPSKVDENFVSRKKDHIRWALDPATEAVQLKDIDQIELIHEALPDLNFQEVRTSVRALGQVLDSPLFISSMTAGHEEGKKINHRLAQLSHEKQILMGVGSQRRELFDRSAQSEWKEIRKLAPKALLLGNLGISQVIQTPVDQIKGLMDTLEACGLFIHLNPLQEALQPEGTPQFRGGLEAIEKLVQNLEIPIIVKEVGCGFSVPTLQRLNSTGIAAVDVSGAGGTHWGRIEGLRSSKGSKLEEAAQVFANWGIGTVAALANAREAHVKYQIWASGGVRSGLDAAKLIALGAEMVGFARPFLEAAIQSDLALFERYESLKYQLQVAQFCTGSRTVEDLQTKGVWKWK